MTLILKGVVKKMDKDYKNNSNIKWNFTKFLIGRDGGIVARFEPTALQEQNVLLEEHSGGCVLFERKDTVEALLAESGRENLYQQSRNERSFSHA